MSKAATKGILGKKLGMTQIIVADGSAVPVTVIEAGPCVVAAKRSTEKDGYASIQLGFGAIKENRVTKPLAGAFKKAGVKPVRTLREFRLESIDSYNVGQEVKVDIFAEGELVDVIGTSKGKGFQGGMKRHRFHGGKRSHGSMHHRQPASGGATDAARTIKGTKKPGHMGDVRVTAQGLTVVRVDGNRNLLLVRGAVPGANNSLVMVKNSTKA